VGEEMCWGLTYRVSWAAARPEIDERRVRLICNDCGSISGRGESKPWGEMCDESRSSRI